MLVAGGWRHVWRPSDIPSISLASEAIYRDASMEIADELDLWVARGGVEPPTFRFSVGRSYQLSYLARIRRAAASVTGSEHQRRTDTTTWRS